MKVFSASINNANGGTEVKLSSLDELLTKMLEGDARFTAYVSVNSVKDAAELMARIATLAGPWPDISNAELIKLHDKKKRTKQEEATYQAALKRPKKRVFASTSVGFGNWCFEITFCGTGSSYPGWETFRPWKESAIASLKDAIAKHKDPAPADKTTSADTTPETTTPENPF